MEHRILKLSFRANFPEIFFFTQPTVPPKRVIRMSCGYDKKCGPDGRGDMIGWMMIMEILQETKIERECFS